MQRALKWMISAAAVGLAACGGSSSGTGSCTPIQLASIAIASGGVSPKAVCVLPAGTVRFTNNDTLQHDIQADSGSGSGCSTLNLGPIAPSQFKDAVFPTLGTCAFHDSGNATNAAFQGTVAVSNAPVSGPGY
jgi:plastocyanin